MDLQAEEPGISTASFIVELTSDGHISVPPEIASQVPPGEQVDVVLRWSDDSALASRDLP